MNTSCRPKPAAGGAQLLRLGRAHRGDEVGEGQSALEEVDLAVPLELAPVVQLPGKPDLGHHLGRKVSLIAGIVDREDRGGIARVPLVQRGAQVDQRQGGVPVVRVEQDRSGHEPRQGSDRGEREEGEPASVVGIVHGVLAVDARPVEVVQVLDEVDLGSGPRPGHPEDARLLGMRSHRNQEGLPHRLEIGVGIAYRAVQRQNGGDVEPGGLLEVGQPADRFGQAADPGVGKVFRGNVDDGDWLASGCSERRCRGHRLASRLTQGRHPVCLKPWEDRRPTPPRESPVRSIPARIPAACAGR